VLYDDAQSIYRGKRRKFNFASVGIEARGRTSILRMNYRNTAEVLALAMQCAQGLLQAVQPARRRTTCSWCTAGQRRPTRCAARADRGAHAQQEADLVAERLAAAHGAARRWPTWPCCAHQGADAPFRAALAARGLAVQSMNAPAFRRFDWRSPPSSCSPAQRQGAGVRPGLRGRPAGCCRGATKLEDAMRLLYVAMTRATRELVLSAHDSGPMVDRVRQALAVVARQFATAS
jgi:superfamily I DNA/RNA helicase